MPAVHTIRLRGPWQFQAQPHTGAAHSGKANLPATAASLLGEAFSGRLVLTRRFNCPSNLEPHEQVSLVIATAGTLVRVALNGADLPPAVGDPAALPLTPHLAPSNELALELELPGDSPAPERPLGEVHLEIGPAAAD